MKTNMMPGQKPYTEQEAITLAKFVAEAAEGDPGEVDEAVVSLRGARLTYDLALSERNEARKERDEALAKADRYRRELISLKIRYGVSLSIEERLFVEAVLG